MKLTPSATAASTSAKISSSRASSASPPPLTLYRPRMMVDRKPSDGSLATCTILASWSLSITGNGRISLRACPGPSSSRLGSGPIAPPIAVTSSSRMASSGGLVTCANICVK